MRKKDKLGYDLLVSRIKSYLKDKDFYLNNCGKREFVVKRQFVTWYLYKNYKDLLSTTDIAGFMGKKDHTTVLHSVKTIEIFYSKPKAYEKELNLIAEIKTDLINYMNSKYEGIDSRDVICCSENENSIEAGISFDETEEGQNILNFHFLEYIGAIKVLHQTTKAMYLNKENTEQLINELKSLKFN